jgi:hypothetical protein
VISLGQPLHDLRRPHCFPADMDQCQEDLRLRMPCSIQHLLLSQYLIYILYPFPDLRPYVPTLSNSNPHVESHG